jgi:hypothetical protein
MPNTNPLPSEGGDDEASEAPTKPLKGEVTTAITEVTAEQIVDVLKTRRPGHSMGTLQMARELTGKGGRAAPDEEVAALRLRIQEVCDTLVEADQLERFITEGKPFYRLSAPPSH